MNIYQKYAICFRNLRKPRQTTFKRIALVVFLNSQEEEPFFR